MIQFFVHQDVADPLLLVYVKAGGQVALQSCPHRI
jgi:hypothetical protein